MEENILYRRDHYRRDHFADLRFSEPVRSEKKIEKLIQSEFTLTQVPAFTLILEKGCKINHVGFIREGTLNLLGTELNGYEYGKGQMKRGDFFGLELFFDEGTALCDALNREPLDCYVIKSRRLIDIVADLPEFKAYLEGLLFKTLKQFFHLPVGHSKSIGGLGREPDREKALTEGQDRSRRFDDAMAYINSHYMDPLTLDMVARKSGLSKFHFSRVFKKETGLSFKDHLTMSRLEAAIKLLALPGINISQACYSVGFNDVSYFARIFKRYTGMSPTDYRRKFLMPQDVSFAKKS